MVGKATDFARIGGLLPNDLIVEMVLADGTSLRFGSDGKLDIPGKEGSRRVTLAYFFAVYPYHAALCMTVYRGRERLTLGNATPR